MSLVNAAVYVVHLLVAALWTGSVLFVAYAILPLGKNGDLNAAPLEAIAGKLTTVSRASALLLFLTGGHMAAYAYTVESLTGNPRGHLVLGMLVLWFVLAGLVEVGASKLTEGTEQDKVREPARNASPFLQGGAVVALLLLVDAGLLVVSGMGIYVL
ncbi:transporter [Salinibaculum rarum]|uniref:transporter n=1 Tax=Salinibaculum rarum TaxID=3058903 RepID=UPI00265E4D28|nr:transporter [Salinibaculum sp. KK48]